jgi:hypothetical protein
MMDAQVLVDAFPMPAGSKLVQAFDNLYVAEWGTDAEKRALGNPAFLPRPWDPGAITDPQLRFETWEWLDDVVTWFNHDFVWNLNAGYLPPCWPEHPHLVHEIAVLADQRRRAGIALTSDLLEDWHRYAVPLFLDRMKTRVHDACDTTHTEWPGRSKHTRHLAAAEQRLDAYMADRDRCAPRKTGGLAIAGA